ncbi:MAG: hypothetical protein M1834_006348 [Cirrosporium novae-zelandiae]|nr:MAG: hypothetical protein M1834_006348 [Cirrosporium novae-zelandiae]
MDFIKNAMGGDKNEESKASTSTSTEQEPKKESGGFLSGISDKINTAAGGGKESEKNEDLLDKGVDFVQEHFMGQGKQDNESAIEQAKDEKISDFIRGQYKSATGKDIPIADK